MAKISVIIPVYNQEKFLEQCLNSVLNQSLSDIEIICIDDGSEDKSLEILENYAQKDQRIRLFKQENQGAGVARNYGFKQATGEFVIFLDSDDFFEPDLLKKLFENIKETNSEVVVCRSDQYNNQTQEFIASPWTIKRDLLPKKNPFRSKEIQENFFDAFVWWAGDKLYRKSYLDKIKIQFMALRAENDLYFSAASLLNSERIFIVEDVLVHHRIATPKSSETLRTNTWDNFLYALEQLEDFMKIENIHSRFERDFLNYCLVFSIWQLDTIKGYSYAYLYNALRKEWFARFGIDKKSRSYFYDNYTYQYEKMQYILKNDLEYHLSERIVDLEEKINKLTEEKQNLEQEKNNLDNLINSSKIVKFYLKTKLNKNKDLKNTDEDI